MNTVDLRFGPLAAEGFRINRSGVQWLYEDGHVCRPNEAIAYCNLSLWRAVGAGPGGTPFETERELQVAFAPRVAGRLRITEDGSGGGHMDTLAVFEWDPDTVIGRLEQVEGESARVDVAGSLRLLMLAGRRATGVADVLTGLLPGWHSRTRGWWCEDEGVPKTLLNLGICDTDGPVRGDRGAFLEMFEHAPRDAQIAVVPNHPVAPCAPCLLEQFTRSAADQQAIIADLKRALADGPTASTAEDWIFAGSFIASMTASPMRDRYEFLTPRGLRQGEPPSSILLSLNAESANILRHKTLGYRLHLLPFHHAAAGPAVKAWIASAFEPLRRTIEDVRADYAALIDRVAANTGARFLILNRMSTSGREDISSYMPFDAPMSATLANVASKELNLMLHDLAEGRDLSIIDADAIAAELGGGSHLPDGVHQSGAMQAIVRSEILAAIR